MNKHSLYDAIGEVGDDFLIDAEQVLENKDKHKAGGRKLKGTIIAIAAVIAVLGTTIAAAASLGYNIIDWVTDGFNSNIGTSDAPDTAILQEELDNGQWAYLNGDNIAVIVPKSPVSIMLSGDGGATWRSSVVEGSEAMTVFGDRYNGIQYYGGYIGTYGDKGSYLILTACVAMNSQPMRIYLSEDNGGTWTEIGNPSDMHSSVLTGAGFASKTVGFISYRYNEEAGPDIWWTKDAGKTWSKLEITLPVEYQSENYRFTPQSPLFFGDEGAYPITVLDTITCQETTIDLRSHDGGFSWAYD